MLLSNVHIWNYRLLLDTNIHLDEALTLIVGKNNAGKTSFLSILQRVLSGRKDLDFADYPIQCRSTLYEVLWKVVKGKISIDKAKDLIPKTAIQFDIDYSNEAEDEYLGALSPFIIDLDINNNIARILVEYQSILSDTIISEITDKISLLKVTNPTAKSKKSSEIIAISNYLSTNFNKIFEISVKAINPTNPSVFR